MTTFQLAALGYILAGWSLGIFQYGVRIGIGISPKSSKSVLELAAVIWLWPFMLLLMAYVRLMRGPPDFNEVVDFYNDEEP